VIEAEYLVGADGGQPAKRDPSVTDDAGAGMLGCRPCQPVTWPRADLAEVRHPCRHRQLLQRSLGQPLSELDMLGIGFAVGTLIFDGNDTYGLIVLDAYEEVVESQPGVSSCPDFGATQCPAASRTTSASAISK
jgi:hypothetical protein